MRSGNESVICCNSLYIGLWMLCTYCIERKDGQGKVFGREVVAASRSNSVFLLVSFSLAHKPY